MQVIDAAIIDFNTWNQWAGEGRAAQLVDVRSATEFATGHIPGAINVPLEQLETRLADLDASRPAVLICQAGTRARMAAELLGGRGLQLYVMARGTADWIKAGNPVVRCVASRWALERQVRLAAGLLVVTGVLLGVTVSQAWLGLAAFVGCGLTFAGLTNICPMGELLARLPWNRVPRAAGDASGKPVAISCACEIQKRD